MKNYKEYSDEKLLSVGKDMWVKLCHSDDISIEDTSELRKKLENNREDLDFDVDKLINIFEELVSRSKSTNSDIKEQDLNSLGPTRDLFE
jgi:hypothetical protein